MRFRWHNLCARIGISEYNAAMQWRKIQLAYFESHRHYHNLSHIDACITELDMFCAWNTFYYKQAVEMAIFFHDIVYWVPGQPKNRESNEEASADAASLFLTGVVDTAFRNKVISCIRATNPSASRTEFDAAQHLMVDIDRSILGQDLSVYAKYKKAIRKEYSAVPDDLFREKRIEFLESMLKIERLFEYSSMQDQYDKFARINMNQEIEELRSV